MTDRRRAAAALDIGRKRIGVAITDPNAEMAMPLSVVHRKGTRKDIAAILRDIGARPFEVWIVGLPTASSQSDDMNKLARGFAIALAATTELDVWLVDEAQTSVQAHNELRSMGLKQARRKQVVDKVAAKIILDRWLAGDAAELVPRQP